MDLLNEYLAHKTEIQMKSLKTIKAYNHDLKVMLPQVVGKTLEKITLEDIKKIKPIEVIKVMTDSVEGLAPTTVNRRLSSLKDFYSYYSTKESFPNILGNMKKLHDTREREVKVLDRVAIERMISATKGARKANQTRDKLILTLLFNTGIRSEELLSLTYDRITDTEIVVLGKGNKLRRIPINSSLKTALIEYGVEGNKTSKVFDLSYQGLRKMYMKYCSKIGVSALSPHSARHSSATLMMEGGGDIVEISKILGHASTDFTINTYVHSTKKLETVNLLNI